MGAWFGVSYDTFLSEISLSLSCASSPTSCKAHLQQINAVGFFSRTPDLPLVILYLPTAKSLVPDMGLKNPVIEITYHGAIR